MPVVRLLTPIASNAVASGLESLIERLESGFPGSITGYFLFGSQATTGAVLGSDLDLALVTAPACAPDMQSAIADACVRHGQDLELPATDPIVFDQATLLANGHFRVKSCSVHLWGADIRPAMPDLSFDTYLRTYMRAPVAYMTRVLRRTDHIVPPVSYPDPDAAYFGYSQPTLAPQNAPVPNVKALVSTACWIASVLVSIRTRQTVASRADAVDLYRRHVGDGWSAYIDEVYRLGNQELGYLIPTEPEQQLRLRRLCREMPGLENHFLARYRDYLLDELGHDDYDIKLLGIERLTEVAYRDAGVTSALARFLDHADANIRAAAAQALDSKMIHARRS